MDVARIRGCIAGCEAVDQPQRPVPNGDLPADYRDLIDGETPAAVLVPLVLPVEAQGPIEVLLTRRTDHLTDHPGQISFPGGRQEAEDADLIATAIRESEEEVGLSAAQLEVIGTLAPYLTITGYVVTPVVALITPPLALRIDPQEVAEAFSVPLAHLLDGTNYRYHKRMINRRGQAHEVGYWSVPYADYDIWGATAGMLQMLRRVLTEDTA
jgi:8-oxo-dGTP pyrophosphatase MutT (NUDIX family)